MGVATKVAKIAPVYEIRRSKYCDLGNMETSLLLGTANSTPLKNALLSMIPLAIHFYSRSGHGDEMLFGDWNDQFGIWRGIEMIDATTKSHRIR